MLCWRNTRAATVEFLFVSLVGCRFQLLTGQLDGGIFAFYSGVVGQVRKDSAK